MTATMVTMVGVERRTVVATMASPWCEPITSLFGNSFFGMFFGGNRVLCSVLLVPTMNFVVDRNSVKDTIYIRNIVPLEVRGYLLTINACGQTLRSCSVRGGYFSAPFFPIYLLSSIYLPTVNSSRNKASEVNGSALCASPLQMIVPSGLLL